MCFFGVTCFCRLTQSLVEHLKIDPAKIGSLDSYFGRSCTIFILISENLLSMPRGFMDCKTWFKIHFNSKHNTMNHSESQKNISKNSNLPSPTSKQHRSKGPFSKRTTKNMGFLVEVLLAKNLLTISQEAKLFAALAAFFLSENSLDFFCWFFFLFFLLCFFFSFIFFHFSLNLKLVHGQNYIDFANDLQEHDQVWPAATWFLIL